MRTSIKNIAAVIAVIITFTASFGKTSRMTISQYNQQVNKIDSSLVGTWEKTWNREQGSKDEFCQFNANGTFISFKIEGTQYTVTGKGRWMVENGTISIVHGEEVAPAVKYENNGIYLVFGQSVSYSKSTLLYAAQ